MNATKSDFSPATRFFLYISVDIQASRVSKIKNERIIRKGFSFRFRYGAIERKRINSSRDSLRVSNNT